MPGLLSLPSELLFEIIDLVANSPNRPPPGGKRHRPEQLHSRSIICVPTTYPSWLEPTRGLLLSCKRLNAETSTYYSTATQNMVLDVAIVDNHWIWPCFRVLPGDLGYVLESLDINLVYCCTEEERAAYTSVTPGWKYEEEFVKMMSRILRSGPSSLSTTSMGSRSDFRIKTITVSVDSASVAKGNETLSEEAIPCRRVDKLSHLSFDPLYSVDLPSCLRHVDWLANSMEHLLHHTHFGLIILERVDRIEFCVDSRTRKVIDIADRQSRKKEKILADYKQRGQD
jgi:hypothetical protein